jgi:hypothetical protein
LKSPRSAGDRVRQADRRAEESSYKKNRENRYWFLAALLLAIVFLISNFQIVDGRGAPIWDAGELIAPAFTLIADHARAGRIVLWNPWVGGGSPDYAEPNFGAVSPVAVFVGAIMGGTETGFRVYWLLIWFLGPLGLLLLARHLRAPPWTGSVVALGFAFCGFYTGQAEHTSALYSISCLPWILWRLDVALETGALRAAVESGGLWGLSALGGYPGLTILSGGFLFLWVLGRCLFASEDKPISPTSSSPGETKPRLWFGFVAVALVLLVGLPILAPTYLAFFSEGGSGYSDRGSSTTSAPGLGVRSRADSIGDGALQVGALSTFASPYLTTLKFGGANPKLWPRTDTALTNVYLGAAISILGLLAIINCPGAPWRWWLLGVASFFLACALGDKLPVRGWLYDLCPPTRYFRNAAMFRIYAMFCVMLLALLAGKDLQAAVKGAGARVWKCFLFAAVLVSISAVVSYYVVIRKVDSSNIENLLATANTGIACVWLGSIGMASLLLFRPDSRRLLPVFVGILAIFDALLTIHLARPTVYSTGFERHVWTRIDKNHSSSLDLTPNGLSRNSRPPGWTAGVCPPWWSVCSGPDTTGVLRNNENVPLKIATFFNYATLTNRFQMDFEHHPMLVDIATGAERIWFSTSVAIVAPSDPAYAAFVKRSEALGAPVLVAHPPPEMASIRERGLGTAAGREAVDAISNLPPAQRVAARVIRYTPNALVLKVDCPQAGWLLVTDRWSRGWRAKVNGESAEVFGGDFIFRAVRVRAGENSIQFDYRPAGWPILFAVSWGTLALVFAGPLVVPRRLLTRLHAQVGWGGKSPTI